MAEGATASATVTATTGNDNVIEEAIGGTLQTVKHENMDVFCVRNGEARNKKLRRRCQRNEVEIAKHYKFGQFGYFSISLFSIHFFFLFNLSRFKLLQMVFADAQLNSSRWRRVNFLIYFFLMPNCNFVFANQKKSGCWSSSRWQKKINHSMPRHL